MKVGKLEAQIKRREGLDVRIVNKNGRKTRVDAAVAVSYPYKKAAPKRWTIAQFVRKRLHHFLPGYHFNVRDAHGRIIHGKMLLGRARLKLVA